MRPPPRFIWTCCLCLLAVVYQAALAAPTQWPDLARVGHVSGRVATNDDVQAGNAAFAIQNSDSKPIRVTIPQYAIYLDRDTGKKVPVILIQAEDKAGSKLAGFRIVGSHGVGACLLDELQLLGTKRPS